MLFRAGRCLSADTVLMIFSFLQVLDFEQGPIEMDDWKFVSIEELIEEVEISMFQFE